MPLLVSDLIQVKFIDYFVSGLFEAWNSKSEQNSAHSIDIISTTSLSLLYVGFCPVPVVIDYLRSNYEYWKNQCPDSPNNSEEEAESGSKRVT